MKGSEYSVEAGKNGLFSDDLRFLVTASHELKSPLSLVRQLALGLQVGQLSSAEQDAIIQQIVLTSERALRLTTDLSRSSRLEDSLFDLEPINPQQLCEDVAHELTPLYAARGREIKVATHRRSMLVVANYDLLRRIMLNFGDNALHYGESDTPVELRARVHGHGTKIRLGVRDYGPAVPANAWKRLRDTLGSTAQPLHSRPQSSGLGLYVAGQFADAMNGEIGATRHRDGATFYVDIDASTQLSLL